MAHGVLGRWRWWCIGGSDPDIVIKEMGTHGDDGVALLCLLLYPRTIATSTMTPAMTRSTKNKVKEDLQDECCQYFLHR
jgi:hypothetical protein